MSGYYKPGLETFANQMKQQKEQMEGLRTTIGEANSAHDSRIENAESFGEQLDGFVAYVEQYKNFQAQQREVLQQVQSSSLEKIQAAAVTQMNQFNESVVALEENNEQLNGEIQKVNEKIDEK